VTVIGGAFGREFSLDGDGELGQVGVADDLAKNRRSASSIPAASSAGTCRQTAST
jgi:hypothetical protein